MKLVNFRGCLRIGLAVLIVPGLLSLTYLSYRGWQMLMWRGLNVPHEPAKSRISQVLNRSTSNDFTSTEEQNNQDILLVTIDTLRADHLSPYDYPKATSPFLKTLSRKGLTFDRAYAPMATTSPSHASILTSLYPLQHGIRNNRQKMSRNITTLQEILREEGYKTVGFVGTNRHFSNSNISQGFDHFNVPERTEQMFETPGNDESRNLSYRPANRTVERAITWLKNQEHDGKLFLWIHLFDPHFPYAKRPKLFQKLSYENRQKRQNYFEFVRRTMKVDLRNGRDAHGPYENNWLAAYRLYDSEIRHADRSLEKLYRSMVETRQKNPFTIVTADHGEGMANHNYWDHGKKIYNEQTRVPLILRWPDNRHAGKRIKAVTELNDLMPTILRYAGIELKTIKNMRNRPMEGTPLQVIMSGNKNSDRFQYAFMERRQFPPINLSRLIGSFYFQLTTNTVNYPFDGRWAPYHERGEEYALAGREYKYYFRTHYPDEVYNLNDDFYETNNLINHSGLQAKILGSTVHDLARILRASRSGNKGLVDESTRQRLESLGYIY